MTAAVVAGLLARRGIIVRWYRAAAATAAGGLSGVAFVIGTSGDVAANEAVAMTFFSDGGTIPTAPLAYYTAAGQSAASIAAGIAAAMTGQTLPGSPLEGWTIAATGPNVAFTPPDALDDVTLDLSGAPHVTATSSSMDSFYSQPVPLDGQGTFGETFPANGVGLVGYFQRVRRTLASMNYGIADEADAQITFGVPFCPTRGIDPLPPWLAEAYNCGQFVQMGQPDDSGAAIALDRIVAFGRTYTPSSPAEPLVEDNRIFAFRLRLKALSGMPA